MSYARTSSVPAWWILAFLALALGLGGLAVLTVGGQLVASGAVLLPALG